MAEQLITKQIVEGKDYYTTWKGKREYVCFQMVEGGRWFVRSSTKTQIGLGRYYDRIADCKPFSMLPALIEAGAI